MKTFKEINDILSASPRVDVHVHTHVCDGATDMTVENIAAVAKERNIGTIVLTPHFHKQLSDETFTLYTDTDEQILLQLREEIDDYQKHGDVKFLLSTETDILSLDGDLSLLVSKETEKALDLITPTMNFNPILPYNMVLLTMGKSRDILHENGEYARAAEKVGGVTAVLEAMYECEANAILRSPYPSMLGHFFSAHSVNTQYSWFGMQKEHLPLMKRGAVKVIEACKQKKAFIDITGLGLKDITVEQKKQKDGFLYNFQKEFIADCKAAGVSVFPGSDSHKLTKVGKVSYHYTALDI